MESTKKGKEEGEKVDALCEQVCRASCSSGVTPFTRDLQKIGTGVKPSITKGQTPALKILKPVARKCNGPIEFKCCQHCKKSVPSTHPGPETCQACRDGGGA